MKLFTISAAVFSLALAILVVYLWVKNARLADRITELESDYGWCREELGLHKYGGEIDKTAQKRMFGFDVYQENAELKSMTARTKIKHERDKMKQKEVQK